ncbi:c-type cytochrome [Microbulbifer taiwanensis]|uniref:C-type cytochrome n=1 Tax=Microbulbifer taiwanensis TaxID=986746 RepID=A0ABW1YJE3_9GAMM|nr:c-type cytochrome [Microbulbifer taiwanensis]
MKPAPVALYLCLFGTVPCSNSFSSDMPPAAEVCAGCHGVYGQGLEKLGPRIAGLSATYISEQVRHFQVGERRNVSMHTLAMEIEGEPLAQVANYFAAQSVRPVTILRRGEKILFTDPAERLAYQGDWPRLLPACVSCHGPSGTGVGDIPRLAGQQADYLRNQLRDWQQGRRKGDRDGVMANIAGKLNDDEIRALSRYFAELE